jgi:hypothetical protein
MTNPPGFNERPPREIPQRVWSALLETPWRELERRRVALARLAGTPIRTVNYECHHAAGLAILAEKSLVASPRPVRQWASVRGHRQSFRQEN